MSTAMCIWPARYIVCKLMCMRRECLPAYSNRFLLARDTSMFTHEDLMPWNTVSGGRVHTCVAIQSAAQFDVRLVKDATQIKRIFQYHLQFERNIANLAGRRANDLIPTRASAVTHYKAIGYTYRVFIGDTRLIDSHRSLGIIRCRVRVGAIECFFFQVLTQ